MIVTEEEAKTKWCPQTTEGVSTELNCVGSKCMWWVPVDNMTRPTKRPDESEWVAAGYCGAINDNHR